MRQSILTILLLLSLCAPSARSFADSFMPVEDLRRGMRGTGKTVFQGTAIDTFAVEILGVARSGLGPRQDLILARLSGGPLATTGVIRGMSGSPVYIDGRLIGAVAYGWSFSKVPICGITPIRQMLRVIERDMSPPPSGSRAALPIELDPSAAALVRASAAPEEPADAISLEPLTTPVWVSGLTPAAGSSLRELLAPLGLEVLDAPGGQTDVDAVRLEPGASLGVQLVSGDMSATGIGTLTYVDGQRLLGFGHPMMLLGSTDMPMTGAYIYDIIPNQLNSFKIGAATRPVGAIRQDRAPGIAGVLGRVPAMLPVAVDITSAHGTTTYRFGVIRHQALLAGLARAVLLASLEAAEKLFGDATLELRAALHIAGGRDLVRQQVYSGPVALVAAALEAVRPLDALVRSPFAPVHLDSLRFSLELREQIESAQVRGLRVSRSELTAGDSLAVEVTLQPYRRAPVRQRLVLALPADLAAGPLSLRVGSGRASQDWEERRRPDAFQPRDIEHLLELLARDARDDELIFELYRGAPGLTVDGRELPALPPAARAILSSDSSVGHLGPVHGQVVLRRRLRTDYVLSGEQTLELTIRKP